MHHGSCGVKINGENPKSKKAIKEALQNGERIDIISFSPFGTERFRIDNAGEDFAGEFFGAGPDPEYKRNFFFHISVKNGKIVVK